VTRGIRFAAFGIYRDGRQASEVELPVLPAPDDR
jgi:hypothetical protein